MNVCLIWTTRGSETETDTVTDIDQLGKHVLDKREGLAPVYKQGIFSCTRIAATATAATHHPTTTITTTKENVGGNFGGFISFFLECDCHLRLELSIETCLHLQAMVAPLGTRGHRIVRINLVVLALQRSRLRNRGRNHCWAHYRYCRRFL